MAYFYTSAQNFSEILAFWQFGGSATGNRFKNPGNHLNVLRVVSYYLSVDISYFFLKSNLKSHFFNSVRALQVKRVCKSPKKVQRSQHVENLLALKA